MRYRLALPTARPVISGPVHVCKYSHRRIAQVHCELRTRAASPQTRSPQIRVAISGGLERAMRSARGESTKTIGAPQKTSMLDSEETLALIFFPPIFCPERGCHG